MALFIIDLMGDDEYIVANILNPNDEKARVEETRRKYLEEAFKRAPKPMLEIVPVDAER